MIGNVLICLPRIHTGTLDPFATGVLVILVGRATRLAQFLSGAEKEYEALIRLGWATDTGDLTGTRLIPGSIPLIRRTRVSLTRAPRDPEQIKKGSPEASLLFFGD
jgi:tRNA pseudouridine55 synthase